MDRELTITSVLLNHQPHPSSHSWVKLLIYEPTETETVATRGKMYAVLALSSKAEIDFTPIMELIIETLQQRYFGQTEGGILQALEITLDAIHKQLLLAGQQDKRLSAGFNFDILVAVSWGTVLYLGQLGSSRACLVRQDKLFDIDEGEQKSASTYLSSGVVKAGDRFLLATNQLLAKFTRKQIQHQLSLLGDTLTQSLEQQLNHDPDSLEAGILLLVDIKQVPSVEDESLQIFNADTLSAQPRLNTTLKSISTATSSTLTSSKSMVTRVWHWHVFGRIPGLPVIIISVCLIGLLSSIAYSHLASQPKAIQNITPTVNQLQQLLTQAQQVSTINPDRATDLLNQMQPTLSNALKSSHDSRLTTINSKRQQLQDQLLNVQTVSPHPLASFSGEAVQPKLVVVDQSVFLITAKHQLIKITAETALTMATNANLYTTSSQLVSTTSGLVELQAKTITALDQFGQTSQTTPGPNQSIISSASYQQNAYLLAKNGQLYKFINQADSLTQSNPYFNTPISASGLVDVAIDGAVYILRQDGSVEKYLSGQPQSISLERSNLAKSSRAIITDENTDNIYILNANSLLLWTKSGQYLGQYRLPNATAMQAATVDSVNKRLYILSEGKLVEAELPQ